MPAASPAMLLWWLAASLSSAVYFHPEVMLDERRKVEQERLAMIDRATGQPLNVSGDLFKRGIFRTTTSVTKLYGRLLKGWRRKWMVLTPDGLLKYYTHEGDTFAQGAIDLRSIDSIVTHAPIIVSSSPAAAHAQHAPVEQLERLHGAAGRGAAGAVRPDTLPQCT